MGQPGAMADFMGGFCTEYLVPWSIRRLPTSARVESSGLRTISGATHHRDGRLLASRSFSNDFIRGRARVVLASCSIMRFAASHACRSLLGSFSAMASLHNSRHFFSSCCVICLLLNLVQF